MASETFTTTEGATDTRGSAAVLWRYLRAVPFLRWGVLPTAFLAVISSGGQQLFFWLSGLLAECPHSQPCPVHELTLGISFQPTLTVLVLLALVVLVARAVQWIGFEVGGQLASTGLLAAMVRGVGRARTTFFDEYPSGKIINRIIKDGDAVRVMAPIRVGDSLGSLVELLIAALLVAVVNPLVAVLTVPVFILFVWTQRNIAPMLQYLMVLKSARFGEVLHRESDLIEGIRCFELYGERRSLLHRLRESVFRYAQMHFLRGQIEGWGRCIAQSAVAVYEAVVLISVYLGVQYGEISAVVAVVIITASMRLAAIFAWLSWSFGLLFESAGQIRRVLEYVDLPPEEAEEGVARASVPPPAGGVPSGDLVFQEYTMRYRPHTPIILDGLSLTIARGSKVGLIGRTGAGKSSLVQALFRMVYVQQGEILVGGVSLLHMPIEEARALFAVVPQDPYLFEGSVRSNLDRAGEFSDRELEDALQAVQLPLPLSHPLLEGGSNLSLGQRQLLCLARVVLTKRQFVIMDEPTSGVDTITDAAMQQVLSSTLADRTIVTIAHRVETLARMDRVIELNEGRVVRDTTPAEVLAMGREISEVLAG